MLKISSMLKHVASWPDYLADALERAPDQSSTDLGRDFEQVLVGGMGGSAIAAEILNDSLYPSLTVPLFPLKDASLPGFVRASTLLVLVSYSGQTRETLSLAKAALRRGNRFVALSSGGQLERLARKRRIPFRKLRGGLAPRAALPYLLVSLARVVEDAGLVKNSNNKIRLGLPDVRRAAKVCAPDTPLLRNPAKQVAARLKGRMALILALKRMESVARRFKCELNENGKTFARYEILPEACHNEIESVWPRGMKVQHIFFRDSNESKFESHMFQTFSKIIKTDGREPFQVEWTTESSFGRVLAPIVIGDHASVYLGHLLGMDPDTVPRIESFKASLENL